jgi:hypothetical protein
VDDDDDHWMRFFPFIGNSTCRILVKAMRPERRFNPGMDGDLTGRRLGQPASPSEASFPRKASKMPHHVEEVSASG